MGIDLRGKACRILRCVNILGVPLSSDKDPFICLSRFWFVKAFGILTVIFSLSLHIYIFICLSACPPAFMTISLPVHSSIRLDPFHPSINLLIHLAIPPAFSAQKSLWNLSWSPSVLGQHLVRAGEAKRASFIFSAKKFLQKNGPFWFVTADHVLFKPQYYWPFNYFD